MDEMKFDSDFSTKLMSKYLKRQIKKKTGFDVDVKIGSVYLSVDDGDTAHISINVKADINKSDLEKIVDDYT